ncbi:type IV secretion system protein [Candidatus Deianiraea vastatrix]|uniref:TrbL/VirB6 plasmid conjugal transfer protein n=1 Tax=Candidatus Deianiraea vastatrix TaxID=2163644 RepID=A0A5B8XEV1_9RICK|nr:type IV secretion system protein [Candidatus Deianiraea vastatrix]QED22944.1 TrbL/VirB6 plasmid conjugal transfer protein [Candidatus Deianiraea vastatrix]
MKRIFTILLLSILIVNFETKKAFSGAGAALIGMTFANMALQDADDDYKKNCPIDFGALVKPVMGFAGPPEEAYACFANTMGLAITTAAAYEAARFGARVGLIFAYSLKFGGAPPTQFEMSLINATAELAGTGAAIGAAMAYVGILNAASNGAKNRAEICKDDVDSNKNNYFPMAYRDSSIASILKKSGLPVVTQDNINDTYGKLCVHDKKNDNYIWIRKNECMWIGDVQFCAYAYKGDSQLLCLRTSSTCPCRHPIDDGSDTEPTVKASNESLYYDSSGNIVIENDSPNFLKHCRMIKSGDSFAFNINSNPIVSRACYQDGDTKNLGQIHFTAKIAQCITETFFNFLQKRITPITTLASLSDDNIKKMDSLGDDIIVLNGIYSSVWNFISAQPSDLVTFPSMDIIGIIKALKSNPSSHQLTATLKNYDLYKSSLQKIPDDPFINATVPSASNMTPFINGVGATGNAISEAINTAKNERDNIATSGMSSSDAQTLFTRLHDAMKATVLMIFLIYISFSAAKILFAAGEVKAKDFIQNHWIFIIVVAFSLNDGWKYIGIRTITMATNAAMDMVEEVTRKDSRDGCSYQAKYFPISEPVFAFAPQGYNYSDFNTIIKLPDSVKYIKGIGGTNLPNDTKLYLDNLCTNLQGSGRIVIMPSIGPDGKSYDRFFCRRGPYLPTPSYNYPFLPIELPSQLIQRLQNNGIQSSYMPVRCTNQNGDLLYWNDNKQDASTSGNINTPYYATFTKRNGREYMLCNPTATSGPTYTAPGYHLSDLEAMGYILNKSAFSNISTGSNLSFQDLVTKKTTIVPTDASGVVFTAYYIADSSGSLSLPFSLQNIPGAFSKRVEMEKIKDLTDQSRKNINNLTRGYPIVSQKDTGAQLDLSYLGRFDELDCKIEKYFMGMIDGLPGVFRIAWMVFFQGPSGCFTAIAALCSAFGVFVICLKVAQNFIVGISTAYICVYVSPITMPLALFSFTADVYKKWLDTLISSITSSCASFLTIYIGTTLMDTAMYGMPGDYGYEKLFNVDGTYNYDCYKPDPNYDVTMADIESLPYACLLLLAFASTTVNPMWFFGMMLFPGVGMYMAITAVVTTMIITTATGPELQYIFFIKSVKMLLVVVISLDFASKTESIMIKMFGGADLSLKGGVGNINDAMSISGVMSKTTGALAFAAKNARNLSETMWNKGKAGWANYNSSKSGSGGGNKSGG